MQTTQMDTFRELIARLTRVLVALVVALSLCGGLPEVSFADTVAGDASGSDVTVGAQDAVPEEDAAVAEDAAQQNVEPLETSIKGLAKSYTLNYKKSLKKTITVSPAYGRSVKLYRYDIYAKKYVLAKTYKTANKKKAKVKIAFPKAWKTQTTTKWKVVAPAVTASSDSNAATGADAVPDANAATAGDGAGETLAGTGESGAAANEESAASEEAASAMPAMEKASRKVTVTCSLGLLCSSAIVMDAKTGEVVFGKDPLKKRAIASITKMMTAILLVEKRKPSSLVKVTKEAARTPYGLGLKKGDKLTVKNTLYAMMLPSANDAACAAGINIGGSTAKFCKLANARAKELGCKSTTYKNAHGLDKAGAGSTAYDQARIASYLMTSKKTKLIRKAVKTKYKKIKTKKGNTYYMASTDKLLGTKWKALGIKTGTETLAGCCFAGAFKIGGRMYVTVVLNAPWSYARFSDTKTLVTFTKYAIKNKLPRQKVS